MTAFPKPLPRPKKKSRGLRRSWMKRRPARRIGRETEAEKQHKRLVREMRVCAVAKYAFAGRCRGGFDVAHLGPSGGTGRQHGDWTMTTLMCHSHHMQLDGHQRPSVFDAMTTEQLRAWKEFEMHLAREFVAGRRTESR